MQAAALQTGPCKTHYAESVIRIGVKPIRGKTKGADSLACGAVQALSGSLDACSVTCSAFCAALQEALALAARLNRLAKSNIRLPPAILMLWCRHSCAPAVLSINRHNRSFSVEQVGALHLSNMQRHRRKAACFA